MSRPKKHAPRRDPKPTPASKPQGRARYTPAELFVALIGIGVIVLFVGIIVSEFLE